MNNRAPHTRKTNNLFRATLVILFAGILISGHAQELQCNKYRNGKFRIEDELTGGSLIDRQGNQQVESDMEEQYKIRFAVNWMDTCTYALQIDSILYNPDKIPFNPEMIIESKIIETHSNGYVIRVSSNKNDMVFVTKMIAISTD